MSFFRKLGDAFARFMYGRNGMDQLNLVLVWGSVGFIVVANLISGISDPMAAVGLVIYYFGMAIWIISLFRMFSKNLEKRRRENGEWLSLWWKIKNGVQGAQKRRADKNHKYFTCKNCKAPFLQLKKFPTHPSPLERKHEGPAHNQGSPVSASELEMRDPFPVS